LSRTATPSAGSFRKRLPDEVPDVPEKALRVLIHAGAGMTAGRFRLRGERRGCRDFPRRRRRLRRSGKLTERASRGTGVLRHGRPSARTSRLQPLRKPSASPTMKRRPSDPAMRPRRRRPREPRPPEPRGSGARRQDVRDGRWERYSRPGRDAEEEGRPGCRPADRACRRPCGQPGTASAPWRGGMPKTPEFHGGRRAGQGGRSWPALPEAVWKLPPERSGTRVGTAAIPTSSGCGRLAV
jgi:hypothetical protein